ncbi:hypothetical protein EV421DRAFT_981701 [Armillaria borealis]|uniref:RING-type domain-containing protein n=1 Tax=Armillaria borealis TaxID=47425 RepID=A0AA39J8B0_9AGAR|nr:hypothetical protein EV421DRAFT_981701 [Armillaria borealis]
MIECLICQDPLTEPHSAPCGHIFCLGCINEWYGSTQRQGRSCTCPFCSAIITKDKTDSLVHELHALRKEVKEVDAYNAFLLAELERCEELRSAAEEKADLATKKGSYPTAATAFLGILTNIVTLAGILTALFDDVMRLVVAVLCLIAELVWRLSTRPGECFRQLGHGIWVAIRVTATLVLLSLISVVVTWAVGTASLKIFQLFLEHGCPPLYDLAKSFWEEISTRFIDISATFIKNYIVDFQAYTEPGICLRQDIVPTIGHLAI